MVGKDGDGEVDTRCSRCEQLAGVSSSSCDDGAPSASIIDSSDTIIKVETCNKGPPDIHMPSNKVTAS